MGEPTGGEFLATIRHILAGEYTEREHFFRRELRAKFRVEIAPHRCGERITIPALHFVADAHDSSLAHNGAARSRLYLRHRDPYLKKSETPQQFGVVRKPHMRSVPDVAISAIRVAIVRRLGFLDRDFELKEGLAHRVGFRLLWRSGVYGDRRWSFVDLASHGEDALAAPEVDIGRRQIVQALMIAAVIVVLDKGGDSALRDRPCRRSRCAPPSVRYPFRLTSLAVQRPPQEAPCSGHATILLPGPTIGLNLRLFNVKDLSELSAKFSTMKEEGSDSLVVLSDALFNAGRRDIIRLAAEFVLQLVVLKLIMVPSTTDTASNTRSVLWIVTMGMGN
jgi:hypothetical protein